MDSSKSFELIKANKKDSLDSENSNSKPLEDFKKPTLSKQTLDIIQQIRDKK